MGLSDDIDGLTIESDGFTNFLKDLTKYGAELLCHNHGFTEKDLNDIDLRCNVTHEFDEGRTTSTGSPEVQISLFHLNVA